MPSRRPSLHPHVPIPEPDGPGSRRLDDGRSHLRMDRLLAGHDGVPHSPCASLDLGPGQVCAVIGANGSGKSTLLHTVVGLLPPVGGTVRFDGVPVDESSVAFRRATAAVLDDDAYLAELTVAEHVELVAAAHGVADSAGSAWSWLVRFQLDPVAHVSPLTLSSGQRRRLLLAAAFVRPSMLLVLDEPESRLDRAGRALVLNELRARAAEGAVVLVATHDPAFVDSCTTALVLADDPDSGSVATVCTPSAAIDGMAR